MFDIISTELERRQKMSYEIAYNIVSDYCIIHNMFFHKKCCVTNLKNGITKKFDTKFILDYLENDKMFTYKTNHLWRRKFSDLDIYFRNEDTEYWVRITAERNK